MSDECEEPIYCEYSGMDMEECPVAIGAWVDNTLFIPNGENDRREIYRKWGRICEHVDGGCAMVAGRQI